AKSLLTIRPWCLTGARERPRIGAACHDSGWCAGFQPNDRVGARFAHGMLNIARQRWSRAELSTRVILAALEERRPAELAAHDGPLARMHEPMAAGHGEQRGHVGSVRDASLAIEVGVALVLKGGERGGALLGVNLQQVRFGEEGFGVV